MYYDNQSEVHLVKNQVFHGITKHITIRYHFIRELINDGAFNLEKINGINNSANMFTKLVMTKH